jgi:hypothetical protein
MQKVKTAVTVEKKLDQTMRSCGFKDMVADLVPLRLPSYPLALNLKPNEN